MVKRGIEASNLGSAGAIRGIALMAAMLWGWCNGASGTRFSSSASVCCVDERRLGEPRAAMDDAMPGRANTVPTEDAIAAPGEKKLNGPRVAEPSAGRPSLFADDARPRARNEPRLGQQILELPSQQRLAARSSSRKTENFRLEEPALNTRSASAMILHHRGKSPASFQTVQAFNPCAPQTVSEFRSGSAVARATV